MTRKTLISNKSDPDLAIVSNVFLPRSEDKLSIRRESLIINCSVCYDLFSILVTASFRTIANHGNSETRWETNATLLDTRGTFLYYFILVNGTIHIHTMATVEDNKRRTSIHLPLDPKWQRSVS